MLKMLAKQKQGGEDNRARTGRENKSASRSTKVTRIKDAPNTTLSTNPSTNRAKLRYTKDSSQTNERSAGLVGAAAGVKRKRAFASDSRLPNKALKNPTTTNYARSMMPIEVTKCKSSRPRLQVILLTMGCQNLMHHCLKWLWQ